MLAFRTSLALLALYLVSASAAPAFNHHHHRRTCRASQSAAAAAVSHSGSASSSPTVAVTDTTTATPTMSTPHTSSSPSSSPSSPSSSGSKSSSSSGSKTSSSSAVATPTSPSSTSSGVLTGLLGHLFPVSHFSDSWSMSPSAKVSLPLTDSSFGIVSEMKSLSHNSVKAPDGQSSIEAIYPSGSWHLSGPKPGGFSFYGKGPAGFDITKAKEVTFSYSVLFPGGFDFVKGGKLPGTYGGSSTDAQSCSGGARRDDCFSVRFMWRTDGEGEVYTYLPPSESANKKVCNVAPHSDCNDTYGASVGRGSFSFKAGTRTVIGERVRLNDLGQKNGEIELFVNGESIFTVSGLVLRTSSDVLFRGGMYQTFFGGSDSSWATPEEQHVYFSDFSLAITETL